PDFDSDFCYERREEVIDYVISKYGKDHVAQIVTFGTMAAKAAIRDVGRVLDIPLSKCNQAAKLIPQMLPKSGEFKKEVHSDFEKVLKGDIEAYRPADQSNIMEFRSFYESDDDIKHIVDIASRLEGLPRSAGTHASGVLIAPEPVYNFVPLARGKDESLVTQYTMIELEEVGMLKMDFLGLRNLSCIDECVKNIKKKYDKDFDLDKIPYDDPNVYKMISNGDTLGIFQLESAGMTNFMKNLGPTCIDDLIAGISLFRPGPMDSIPKYVDSKKNKDHIAYDCPQLMKVLESTYGCIVYQEQVMEIFRELAGFSLGRADEVRRAMSKKKKEKLMAEEKNFIEGNPELNIDGCIKRGIDRDVAKKIFDEMSSFAEYAFNKSHAAAYARLAYQTAYLKYYYKVEFFSSICNSAIGNRDLLSEYVSNIQINGIKILPCDINKSSIGFTVDGDDIRLGMAA
ncbi:MAG: DNA polymerase III subunit alpha, partial [Lachnospiraceae bacterium]|nr:DNA polymerase III subunit alpha [Lachnospiraceae bacterium]